MNKTIHRLLTLALLLAAMTGLTSSCHDSELTDGIETVAPNESAGEPFQWTRAEDVETRHAFMRNFGVGYSYDAVRGEYCNWEDIRCQVINRKELENAMKNYGASPLWNSYYTPSYSSTTQFEFSQRDYIASGTMHFKEETNLGLYNGTSRKDQYVLEDGVQENFYYITTDVITLGQQSLDVASILAVAQYDLESVLTQSFIDAVNHLAMKPVADFASIDSFTNVWGTHVITESMLGGKLKIDLQNRMWRYNDQVREESYTSKDVLGLYSKREEHRRSAAEFKFITDANLNITAYGGDQTPLTSLLGEYKYDGTRDFSLDGIKAWTESLRFDREDDEKSNVEMVDMKVTPIWRFIEVLNEDVANQVKAHILSDAKAMNAILGDRNFFSAKFPTKFASCDFRYRKGTADWKSISRQDSEAQPMVVNIVSGGRYIATVCHEKLEGNWYWVAYPIYEGKVKLACGLGLREDNDSHWVVRWKNGKLDLTELTYSGEMVKPASDTFYINSGLLSFEPSEAVDYAECEALPYYELSGGIRPDGTYESKAYPVVKEGSNFVCYEAPQNAIPALISWEKVNNSYWRRLKEFTYIYNPNETKK